jgi:hypothetical protein
MHWKQMLHETAAAYVTNLGVNGASYFICGSPVQPVGTHLGSQMLLHLTLQLPKLL